MTTEVLRSLYERAVHAFAFVRRDVSLTNTLVQSAFAILQPPVSFPDPLTEFRRKWDTLRITLETVVYTSSPSSLQKDLPDELKKMLLESPRALLQSMYTRSLTLFTPTGCAPSPAYLPGRVLLTLVYSSINVNCYDGGRYMIEEWLARRDPLLLPDSIPVGPRESDTYWKVLELYCLHILPNLGQWDYAREFLEHETELPDPARQELKTSLEALRARTLDTRKTPQPQLRWFTGVSASLPLSNRTSSPTPSASSSSSLSTASSTHTVKPSDARGRRDLNGLSSLSALPSASASTTSLSSDTTATPREISSPRKTNYTNGHGNLHHHPNGSHHPSKPSPSTNRSPSSSSHPSSSSSSPWSSLPFVSSQATTCDSSNPSLYVLIKKTLTSYFTPQKLSTLLIIFVLFPMISFILRFRHKRRKLLTGGGGATGPNASGGVTPLRNGSSGALGSSNADLVRKRLQHIGAGGDGSLIHRMWAEVVRMVMDTVKMAGSGLV